jgi:hypothetical protein
LKRRRHKTCGDDGSSRVAPHGRRGGQGLVRMSDRYPMKLFSIGFSHVLLGLV